jgi:hypothetical protein
MRWLYAALIIHCVDCSVAESQKIMDPDPTKSCGSDRIRIRNTDKSFILYLSFLWVYDNFIPDIRLDRYVFGWALGLTLGKFLSQCCGSGFWPFLSDPDPDPDLWDRIWIRILGLKITLNKLFCVCKSHKYLRNLCFLTFWFMDILFRANLRKKNS